MTRRARLSLATIVLSALALFAMPAGALAFGPLLSFSSAGQGAGQLRGPANLAIAADGTTYVADGSNNRIDVFTAQGGFLFAFGKGVNVGDNSDRCTAASGCRAGLMSIVAGALSDPESVAIGPEGNLFVVERNNRRVSVFTPQGTFLFAFGLEVNVEDNSDRCAAASGCRAGQGSGLAGGLSQPTGLDFDNAGNLFVADRENHRIAVYSAQGSFLFAFGKGVNVKDGSDLCTAVSGCKIGVSNDAAGAMDRPNDVKATAGGRLVVSDQENHRIDVFGTGGEFLYAFGKNVDAGGIANICTALTGCKTGEAGVAAGALGAPSAIDVDANGVYVAEEGLNRIDQFGIDGSFTRAFGAGVISGTEAFEVCTPATGCRAGADTEAPGAIAGPFGVALDCRGAVYATAGIAMGFSRVIRFGDPGTASAPCPASAPTPRPSPSNKFKIGKLKLNKAKGTATLLVEVPDAGTLTLKGKGLRRATRSSRGAGRIQLPVKPVGKAKRTLVKGGAVKLKVALTFTPTGGTSATQSKRLMLRKTAPRQVRRRH